MYQAFNAAGVNLNTASLGSLPILTQQQLQTAAAFGTGSAPDPFLRGNFLTMASDFRNPKSFQTGIGFDAEPVRNLVTGVQVNLVNTSYLQRNRNYNLPIPVVAATDATRRPSFAPALAGARPISTINDLTIRESNARGLYRGLTFQTQYRVRKLQFGGFYTWSEAFSDDDNERDSGGFTYDNPYNLKNDYGYSRNDIRHQFTSNAVYTLPLAFEVSGIFRAYSGRPISPITGADSNGDGSRAATGRTCRRGRFSRATISATGGRIHGFPGVEGVCGG